MPRGDGFNVDVVFLTLTYMISTAAWALSQALSMTSQQDFSFQTSTFRSTAKVLTAEPDPRKSGLCCDGLLGYASDNVSFNSNFPCQDLPCCNTSHTIAVVSINHAMGFRFQCMPRTSIQPACYTQGSEVVTSNQDPDFVPRACCPGLQFHVVLNKWYAATIIKCVDPDDRHQ